MFEVDEDMEDLMDYNFSYYSPLEEIDEVLYLEEVLVNL